LSTTVAGGTYRASSGTRSSCDAPKDCRVAIFQRSKYGRHWPGASSGDGGVINRLKIVRAGWRATMSAIVGGTRCFQDVSQIPPLAKMSCISTHRWTAFSIGFIDPTRFAALLRRSAVGSIR
jgi:hypothetical protein